MPFFLTYNLPTFEIQNRNIMEEQTLGDQIREARKAHNLNQMDLAFKCHLDIRTIQRIESGEVMPRLYTLRIINEALGTEFVKKPTSEDTNTEIALLQNQFETRRKIRIGLFVFALFILISAGLTGLNGWILFGLRKMQWAPYVYVIMFGILFAIVMIWRCPGCNSILGDVFNTRYCSKCGLQLRRKT